MPYDNFEDSPGKIITSQQSPKESSCGWDDDVQYAPDIAAQAALNLGEVDEVQPKADCGCKDELHQNFTNSNHVTTPSMGISRNRSEGDVRMPHYEEKRTMKQSGSEPCLSKRKRSFDATGENTNTEMNKRVHEEQGW